MTRSTPFSYACGRCSRCCHHNGIALNPYEVLRLARHEGLTTTEFIARYTDRAGTLLKQRADGSCVFLGATGCGVHADRPLVCRIYPLARQLSPAGDETFSELEPHPQTEGRYGTQGTVGHYLEAQGAEPFMQAADRYLSLFSELTDSLAERVERLAAPERAAVKGQFVSPTVDAQPALDWLDIDCTVDEYCRARGLARPDQAQQLMEMHVEAVLSLSSHFAQENAT